MYRVLIADDESIIREGIKCLFDWESLGYTIAGEAANGETAYQQILALQPDIVLLDIRMPGMSKRTISGRQEHRVLPEKSLS